MEGGVKNEMGEKVNKMEEGVKNEIGEKLRMRWKVGLRMIWEEEWDGRGSYEWN